VLVGAQEQHTTFAAVVAIAACRLESGRPATDDEQLRDVQILTCSVMGGVPSDLLRQRVSQATGRLPRGQPVPAGPESMPAYFELAERVSWQHSSLVDPG
jgi:hypothetical protein